MFEWFKRTAPLKDNFKSTPEKPRCDTVLTNTIGPNGKVELKAKLAVYWKEPGVNWSGNHFYTESSVFLDFYTSTEVREYIKNLRLLIPEAEKLAAQMDAELAGHEA